MNVAVVVFVVVVEVVVVAVAAVVAVVEEVETHLVETVGLKTPGTQEIGVENGIDGPQGESRILYQNGVHGQQGSIEEEAHTESNFIQTCRCCCC